MCFEGDAKQSLIADGPHDGILVLYAISYTINADGIFSIGDAGHVFKQRLCAARHLAHLGHTFGALQYTLQCVTKEIHANRQANANRQGSASCSIAPASPTCAEHVQAVTTHVQAKSSWATNMTK